ncbi:unnamed protein product [Ceutorhynchus assimilis]|uniref:DUF7869 domain-containing protein n=1 Tax=Ceutorhynchus assimilis TaxID=467358 RepID=A0A9N9MF32_9CUCU|nr:unnamed protein product [Ceutorhynchus assimilis]
MSDYLSDTSDTDPFHNSDDSDKDPDYVDSSDNENNQGFTVQAPSSTTDTSEDEFDEDQAGPSRPHVTTSRTDTSHITANDEIIENEAENNDAGMETKTKKRKRRPEKWKKNINKLKRNSGKQYINKKGIVVSEKRSDTCSSCDVMKIRIEAASTEEERRELTVQKEVHLRKAQAFYDDLKEKSELAVTDPSVETICFDYQQNLPLPVLTTGDIFYARQIWVYNQMFHSCSNNQSVSYMFDEMTAKKGCIESISFLMHFIEKYVSKTVTTLYIFTDNCAGQNKNAVMVHFLLALVSNGRFRKIVHHLPEPGHSFLPCDRNFGQIEKKKRKKELLYLPDEWYDLVQSCGKKFVVERVEQDIIFDFKSYLEPYFKKTSVIKKKPFTISKYRIFIYDSVQPDQVLVTETHNIALVVGYPLYKSPGTKIDLHVAPLAYHEKLALKTKKYDSIMPIVKKYVPPIYLEYYNTIKRAADENNAEDSD